MPNWYDNQTPWRRRAFYLHAGWHFNYPFSVLSWSANDFGDMFALLNAFGINTVMLWPMMEAIPAPLSSEDASELRIVRDVIGRARDLGLECWVTQTANFTSKPTIADRPLKQRHLYPHARTIRLDDVVERNAYFAHRASMLEIVNNADAYVTIDGDPGSYPDANPENFVDVLGFDRSTIDKHGAFPNRQSVVPWMWCGWGNHWDTLGPWNEPIEPLNAPLLECIKQRLAEPWQLLPGRSFHEKHANGRVNIDMAERAGLIDRSMLMLYEVVEFEPIPPACVIQFDAIRRVLRQEGRHASTARGCMVNAQQPVMALPNLWFFARGAADPAYLARPDLTVLRDFAEFLGGDADLLIPAWTSLQSAAVSADLSHRLRQSNLKSTAAQFIPGGADRYLEILGSFVDARVRVSAACASMPVSSADLSEGISAGLSALIDWWTIHGYVGTGEAGEGFRLEYTHSALSQPLRIWAQAHLGHAEIGEVAKQVADACELSVDSATEAVKALMR